tara:strand:- start:18 stop:764 length:747 start_codon:yes stop_codon:yes gene_type:complete
MAVDINIVYQKVLALANKEQRGYITPQEFNLFADKVQLEIFNNYFHKIKLTDKKPQSQEDYADELEMIEEKLHPFHVDETVTTSTASLTLPTNMNKIISITRNGNEVTQLNKHQIAYTENNPLLKATLTRSVFVREDSGKVTIYPSPSASTYDTSTDTTNDSPTVTFEAEAFEVSYYKKPTPPSWGYIIVNGKPLYNSNTSVNFELHGSEEEVIVYRILTLAGLTTKSPDLQQMGVGGLQLNKQEQNS